MKYKTILSLLALLLLSACGGGDFPPEEDRATIDPVDCKATPERCV